jgi:hypothetical protein
MPTAVEEKDAIWEVLAQYCCQLDDGRFTEMAALFTENGTWDTAFGRATGRRFGAQPQGTGRRSAAAGGPSRDQYFDHSRRHERAGALELDGRAKQSRGAKNQLGRRLSRRVGQRARPVAVPLSQDRPLHRPLMCELLGSHDLALSTTAIPAKAGTHSSSARSVDAWAPVCTGATTTIGRA